MKIDKMKRILAWIGIVILAAVYIAVFVLGIFGSAAVSDLLMACVILTVVIPVLFWAMIHIAQILENNNEDKEK